MLLNSVISFYVKSRQLILGLEFNQIFREKTTSQNLIIRFVQEDKTRQSSNPKKWADFAKIFVSICIGATITLILLSIVGMTFATNAMVAVIATCIAIAFVIVTIFHTTFCVFCTVIQVALELLEFNYIVKKFEEDWTRISPKMKIPM